MNSLIYTVHVMNNKQKEDTATLGILQAIEGQEDVTQRHLADKLGVALGLTNSYLKRCVRKGLVKVHQAPANRYLYYLTPNGFTEKSRLTAAYLSSSFNFYRDASDSVSEIYNDCEAKNWSRILFCGVSELAEIASIRAQEHDISIIGTWDFSSDKNKYLHMPVWTSLEQVNDYDACLITSLQNAEQFLELLSENIDHEIILVPSILGISQVKNK